MILLFSISNGAKAAEMSGAKSAIAAAALFYHGSAPPSYDMLLL